MALTKVTSGVIDTLTGLTISASTPSIQMTDSDNNADAFIQATDGNIRLFADDNQEASDSIITFAVDGTERIRVSPAGLHIGGTASANALDDYEEGTWTPVLQAYSGGVLTATYSSQSGTYRKFGNLVFITFGVTCTAISSQASGNDYSVISGLPFAQSGASYVESGNVTRNEAFNGSPAITKSMGGGSTIFFGVDGTGFNFPPYSANPPWQTGQVSGVLWYYTT